MKRTFAALVLLVCAACGMAVSPDGVPGVVLRTDRAVYAPGDAVALELVNASPATVGYNLCGAALERRSGSDWEPVEGPGQVCPMILLTLQPGGRAEGRVVLPAGLPDAVYRVRTGIEERGGDRMSVASDEFTVR